MHVRILVAVAVAHVDAELHHSETVALQILSKAGVVPSFFSGFGRQVEEDEYPHDPIFIQAAHSIRDTAPCGCRLGNIVPDSRWCVVPLQARGFVSLPTAHQPSVISIICLSVRW